MFLQTCSGKVNFNIFPAFLLLVANLSFSFGQTNKIDSLTQELSTTRNDTLEAFILIELSEMHLSIDINKSEYYAYQSLKKSIDIGYERGVAKSHYILGLLKEGDGRYDSSQYHHSKSMELFVFLKDRKGEASALLGLSYLYETMNQRQKSFEYGLRALNIYDTLGDMRSVATSYLHLGNIFLVEGSKNIDNINPELGYFKALEFYNKALSIFNSLHDEIGIAKGYNNISNVYDKIGKRDSALQLLHKSLALSKKTGDVLQTAITHNNIGKIYRDLGKYDSAMFYLMQSDQLYYKMNNSWGRVSPLASIAKICLLRGDYDRALKYANECYAIAIEINDLMSKVVATKNLYPIFEAINDYEKAFEYLSLYKIYLDSLYNFERSREVSNLELSYGVEKKDQQILALQKEREIEILKRNILVASVVLTILAAVIVYLFQWQRIRKNHQLLEKEKEVDKVKSRFFANISHEFRTPLTLILGPLEEIREKVPDRQSQLYLGMMQKNARKLLNQVNQLLDLSKLDSGQLKLHVEHGEIVGFVKGVTMCFESLALSRNIDLAFFADQETCYAWFDKDCIEKIMVNLLSNAFKFTKEAGRVSVQMSKSAEGKIQIKVSDTGRGIDARELDKIFERYYHTESDLQASSGIGLALVKELVESHHGTINVRSAKNQGCNFTITLPLGKDHWKDKSVFEENAGVSNQRPIEPAFDYDLSSEENGREASGNQKTVLVIEDNADVRLFIRESLKEKFDVLEAENGEMGLEKGEESIPDVIITDIMMDGMDGYEVVKRLKQSEKTSHIPVIMLTARADVESKLKGLENEADDFIPKPFGRRELVVRISNLISNREKLKSRFNNSMVLKPGDIHISSIDQVFMEKLLSAIEENIDNNTFGVEELAEKVGMSRSQLHRKLQAIADQPPNQFIRNIRLSRAMELLKNNTGTVAEIAYMTGFTSPNYFSKCFNDKYGCAPGEVKKNLV